ncbi:MAG: glycosyltransferase family 2 protein [Ignavibacteria bacterium]|nr:glycosyltransferase family 2 protein [Ignavibacteria bacterium]
MQEKETRQDQQKNKSVAYKRYGNRRRRYHHKHQPSTQHRKRSAFRKISLVIPLYNEEESVVPLSHEIRKALSKINVDYEVILIDDGSTDLSLKELKEICRTDNRFKYISFRKNYGKSAALHVGFKKAVGEAIITMDADLQDDPHEIPNLLAKLEEGFDLCSGWKKKRQDPFIKKISSKFFNFVTRVISGIRIHDFNCGLKAYRKAVVESVKVYGELHRYIPVFAKWQGYKITETPVQHHPRRYGKTKFGLSRFFKGFIDLVTVIFVTRYIKRPMHFFGFLGALAFISGFILLGYLTVLWIQGIPLSNRPMLFLGMLLIIVGVQLFAVGLLGEVIVHNSMDEREYVIKDQN